MLIAVFDLSALMSHVTRFTEEIFAALISIMYIVRAFEASLILPSTKHTPNPAALSPPWPSEHCVSQAPTRTITDPLSHPLTPVSTIL